MFCFKFQRVVCPLPLPKQDPGTSPTTENKRPKQSPGEAAQRRTGLAYRLLHTKEIITPPVFIRPRFCPVTSVLFTVLMFDSHRGGKTGNVLSKWFSTCNYVVTYLLVSPDGIRSNGKYGPKKKEKSLQAFLRW